MTSTTRLRCNAQLRLLLPQEMISELDTLARSCFVSRLSLIRFYLRTMIDKDLTDLSEHFNQRKQFEITREKLNEKLLDFED